MRIHRIHVPQPLEPERELRLTGDRAHYLGRVLRVAPGQSLVLFNGDGHEYAAEVVGGGRGELAVAVRSRLPGLPESPLALTVVQAVSRGERMDLTLQKCTELGVSGFRLLLTERVEVRLGGDRLAKRMQHWDSVVVSACEQSGRCRVPEVGEPRPLDDWLAVDPPAGVQRLVLAPGADLRLADVPPAPGYELAVGPEGGFSDAELLRMEARGVRPVSIGPRILRTETAAPAAVAVLQAVHGDL